MYAFRQYRVTKAEASKSLLQKNLASCQAVPFLFQKSVNASMHSKFSCNLANPYETAGCVTMCANISASFKPESLISSSNHLGLTGPFLKWVYPSKTVKMKNEFTNSREEA